MSHTFSSPSSLLEARTPALSGHHCTQFMLLEWCRSSTTAPSSFLLSKTLTIPPPHPVTTRFSSLADQSTHVMSAPWASLATSQCPGPFLESQNLIVLSSDTDTISWEVLGWKHTSLTTAVCPSNLILGFSSGDSTPARDPLATDCLPWSFSATRPLSFVSSSSRDHRRTMPSLSPLQNEAPPVEVARENSALDSWPTRIRSATEGLPYSLSFARSGCLSVFHT
mmetsp:Transcript_976/g.3754  ORF Transcript_976/g.3754 Transcript_976/m.3754 type:complete len:224 (+) Transcript_976:971-1642(+)